MGMRAEINKDSPDAGTFGVLALRYLDAETRDDAVVHYVKKVMIPAWGNTVADDIKRKDVRDWLKTLDYSGPTIGRSKASCTPSTSTGCSRNSVPRIPVAAGDSKA